MAVIVHPTATRTLGDLKTRIADELARSDLTNQIALAISDAIEEACTHRFWFMEERGVGAIVANEGTYSSATIENLIEIDRVALVINSQRRTLRPMSDDEVDRWSDGTAPQGEPYAYSRYGDELRFYPIPRQAYTITIDGIYKGATLESDTYSNIWTDISKGERLIRALAKRNIYAEVIRKPDAAQVMDALAKRYREEFQQATHSRVATGEMAYHA